MPEVAMAWKYFRGKDFFWRWTSLWATLLRSLPRKVVISKSKTSCGPRNKFQPTMWPPGAHGSDTPDANHHKVENEKTIQVEENGTLISKTLRLANAQMT